MLHPARCELCLLVGDSHCKVIHDRNRIVRESRGRFILQDCLASDNRDSELSAALPRFGQSSDARIHTCCPRWVERIRSTFRGFRTGHSKERRDVAMQLTGSLSVAALSVGIFSISGLANAEPPSGESRPRGRAGYADARIIERFLGVSADHSDFDARADLNHDGAVSVLDAAMARQGRRPRRTHGPDLAGGRIDEQGTRQEPAGVAGQDSA